MDNKDTMDLIEAAKFLGFTGTQHLREKAKQGQIPGAFKASNRWMFLRAELEDFARNFYKRLHERNNIRRTWPSAKEARAQFTTPTSQSMESACEKAREQILNQKHSASKKNDEPK